MTDGAVSAETMNELDRQDTSWISWLLQLLSGLLLILLLALHMIAHHFIVEGGLRTYSEVIDYISNPIIFALEVIFMIIVAPHAMLGLYSIVLDLGPGVRARRIIGWIFAAITVVTVGFGIWLAIALQNL